MDKILGLVVALLMLTGHVNAADDPDVRNVRWGMSHDEVKKLETEELFRAEADKLYYSATILGIECHIVYFFGETGLDEVKYFFYPDSPSSAKAVFFEISRTLVEKYGRYPPGMTENDKQLSQAVENVLQDFESARSAITLHNFYDPGEFISVIYKDQVKAQKEREDLRRKIQEYEERRRRELSQF